MNFLNAEEIGYLYSKRGLESSRSSSFTTVSPLPVERKNRDEKEHDERQAVQLISLPTEIQEEIIKKLTNYRELIALASTCTHFQRMVISRLSAHCQSSVFRLSFDCDRHWHHHASHHMIDIQYKDLIQTYSSESIEIRNFFFDKCRHLVIQTFCECLDIISDSMPVLENLAFLDMDFFKFNRLENKAAENLLISRIERTFPRLERLHLHFIDYDMFELFKRLIQLRSLRHLQIETPSFFYEDDYKVYSGTDVLHLETLLFKTTKLSNVRMFLEMFVDASKLRKLSLFEMKITLRKEAQELNALFVLLDHFKQLSSFSTDLFQDYLHCHLNTHTFINLIPRLDSLFLGGFVNTPTSSKEDRLFMTSRPWPMPSPKYYFAWNDFKRIFSNRDCFFGGKLRELSITFGFINRHVYTSLIKTIFILQKLLALLGLRERESNLSVIEVTFLYHANNDQLTLNDFLTVFCNPEIAELLNNYKHEIGKFFLRIHF